MSPIGKAKRIGEREVLMDGVVSQYMMGRLVMGHKTLWGPG